MPHPAEYDHEARARDRRRRAHQRLDSNEHVAHRSHRRDGYEYTSPSSSPTKGRPKENRERQSTRMIEPGNHSAGSAGLSSTRLAQLDKLNRKLGWDERDGMQRPRVDDDDEETRAEYDDDRERERQEREQERHRRREERRERRRREREEMQGDELDGVLAAGRGPAKHRPAERELNRRLVSGQRLERGSRAYYGEKEEYREDVRRHDGGSSSDHDHEEGELRRKRRRNIVIALAVILVGLAIAIPVGVVVSRKASDSSSSGGTPSPSSAAKPPNGNLNGMSETSIPHPYRGTSFDPFSWYDTADFNVTFTPTLVGGLPIMGLNDTWDDSKAANTNTPMLNQTWQYGVMPIRGVNLGGWLSLEPFITPSFFSSYTTHENVVDEYTLTQTLGSRAKSTLDAHYSQFVSEQTFADIQAAGFDHVRIPFSYWAVITYDGDPYVANVSWRYLLRGIEWARKYGLRVNLDLHAAPGSQNGWNHSGRQGQIGWLNGTDGILNGQRALDIHKQLSTFFTQPRYKNIVTMYGLVNEPRMTALDTKTVLTWTQSAINEIRQNNFTGIIVFGDGFLGLDKWQGELQNNANLLLDVHQYVIFNVDQIVLNHRDKINFACGGWTAQARQSGNKATGFGPTLCGEWSQADTDCAQYLNNVGIGSRWQGTLNMVGTPGGSTNGSVLLPTCPTGNNPMCSCDGANADPSTYSPQYKQWLLNFAEAQMDSFEQGWGWFYWTWQTEKATQWSYKAGLAAGILPKLAYKRDWNCNMTIPDYGAQGLPENY